MKLLKGDCLEIMKYIPDESIDMILCDLPYGTTKNKFDIRIDLSSLWTEYIRIIKKRGCIALFSQSPFDKCLAVSNIEMLKYEWIWEKPMATGHLNAKFAPMKAHENILIFSKSSICKMIYNPQMSEGVPFIVTSGGTSSNYNKQQNKKLIINRGTRYPRSVIKFSHDRGKLRIHPTQKPVALLEYLIKTYTNENYIVLDNCFGSCSTGVACVHTHRNFIGIEKNREFFMKGRQWLLDEINMR